MYEWPLTLGRIVGLLWPVLAGDEQVVPVAALDQRRDLELEVVPRQSEPGLKLPLFEVVVLRGVVPGVADEGRPDRHRRP